MALAVGALVGLFVGDCVGFAVAPGASVGAPVGDIVVGAPVGATVGAAVGAGVVVTIFGALDVTPVIDAATAATNVSFTPALTEARVTLEPAGTITFVTTSTVAVVVGVWTGNVTFFPVTDLIAAVNVAVFFIVDETDAAFA